MTTILEGIKVAILAENGFEQSELEEPKKALEEAGASTFVVSPEKGEIIGWSNKNWGRSVHVDKQLEEITADQFDALLLPGGVINPDILRMNPKAVHFVKTFFEKSKPVAAICHGPIMLVEAGVLKGKTLTSWPSVRTDIKNAGGNVVDEPAVVDGNLLTSRHPGDIPAFNEQMIKLFAQRKK